MSSPYADSFLPSAEGKIHSMHHEDFSSTGWTSPNGIEVIPSNVVHQNDGKVAIVTYKLETGYKFLEGSSLGVDVPHTELRDEYKGMYRYRYNRDLPYRIVKECKFGSSDTDVGSLNPYGQEALADCFTPPGDRDALQQDMGHDTICCWTTSSMPKKTVYAPQQFGYGLCGAVKSWPLYKQKKTSKVFHEYRFLLHVIRFIEMERLDDTTETLQWVLCEPEQKYFKSLPTAFAQPRLYCKLSDVSPIEMVKRSQGTDTNDFHILRMVKCDLPNKFGPGTSVSIPITCPGLCQALFFSMENVTHKKYNRASYIAGSVNDAWCKSSIESCTLALPQGSKYKDLPSQLLETQFGVHVLPSKGLKRGLHRHLFTNYIGAENNGGACLTGLNMVMKCTISSDAPEGSTFKPHAQMLVIQRCTFKEDGSFTIV